ncbi:hypothetical protein [Aliihoeflea sp. 40Bstr573]|uniref:hypothetical protein n=1 Tax=Aliihoeflea sp. 40Bstr573 TaxID=2696467 RepID=UPI002096484C|nr:hypothetical protein [Aliihoeflea sp. 40Bstr573]MCO6389368.1 hypothetical protein [Aliihoeflea sp. 40Bstr573]
METESLTYKELAERLGTQPDSARKLVKRRRWQKRKGNDGEVRVSVPVEYLEGTRAPDREPAQDSAREDDRDAEFAVLEVQIAALREIVAAERRRAEAAEADRDRWHDLAVRPWWKRLAG